MESYLPRICLSFNIKEEKKKMIFKSKIEDIPLSFYTWNPFQTSYQVAVIRFCRENVWYIEDFRKASFNSEANDDRLLL